MLEPAELLRLGVAVGLTVAAYGFARVAAHLLRNQRDWWHPEKVMEDLFLMMFLTPTLMGRTLLGLREPGRAATISEVAMAIAVSAGLFASTGAILVLG